MQPHPPSYGRSPAARSAPNRGRLLTARHTREYARWQCEYTQARPQADRLRLPHLLEERRLARSLLEAEAADAAVIGPDGEGQGYGGSPEAEKEAELQLQLEFERRERERARCEVEELRSQLSEVEAAAEEDLALQPQAALRRHAMREAERLRIQEEVARLGACRTKADLSLQARLATSSEEVLRSLQACDVLEEQVRPLRASLQGRDAQLSRLREARRQEEAQAEAEEEEIARLQARVERLRQEVVSEDFKRERAEAEGAARIRLQRWGAMCSALLVRQCEREWQLEVEEFEMLVRACELHAGPEAPVAPKPDGFYDEGFGIRREGDGGGGAN